MLFHFFFINNGQKSYVQIHIEDNWPSHDLHFAALSRNASPKLYFIDLKDIPVKLWL